MTDYYKQFKLAVHAFIDNPSKENAKKFADYVDDFWCEHELQLFDASEPKTKDELAIVDDVMMLCDRFDECDEIVKHDSYCIDANQLFTSIVSKIEQIDNPIYD